MAIEVDDAEVEILGLVPDESRMATARSIDGRLAATVEVRSTAPEPRTVRLGPAGPGDRTPTLEP